MTPRRFFVLLAILAFVLVACTPVMDPARWDPNTYCRSVHYVDPVCK